MNTVIIAVGIVLLVLSMKFIILPLVKLLLKLLGQILKYLFRFLAYVFKILLYFIKWALISVPVVIIVLAVNPNLINIKAYLIAISLLTVIDILILSRIVRNYYKSHYTEEEFYNHYVLNKRSKIAHWFLDPSAFTISDKNAIHVIASDSELAEMGYRKKRSN